MSQTTPATDNTQARAHQKLLMEVAVSGVFYGLGGIAERLFAYLETELEAVQLIGLARALSAMGRGDNGDALLIMEHLCERYPEDEDLQAVQALAAKRAGHGSRADKILAGLAKPSGLAEEISVVLRAHG